MARRPTPGADEVRAIFTQARAAESNPPRKHHLVPSFYLRNWERDGKLRVTDLDKGSSWLAPSRKALRETDFYDLGSEDLDPDTVPPLLMETLMARLEREAGPAIQRLLDSPAAFTPDDRFILSNLLAFQFTRGRGMRSELKHLANEFFKVQFTNLTTAGIRKALKRRGVDPTDKLVEESRRFLDDVRHGRLWVEPQRAQLAHQAAEHAVQLAEYLFERVWVVYSVPPLLATSDEPIVPIQGPGRPRHRRAGLGNAGVVVFPLRPRALLAMVRPDLAEGWGLPARFDCIYRDTLTWLETVEVTHELMAHATRYVVELPDRRLASRLKVGSLPEAADFDEVARMSSDKGERSLMRLSKRNRWAAADLVPPWPVQQWWRPRVEAGGYDVVAGLPDDDFDAPQPST